MDLENHYPKRSTPQITRETRTEVRNYPSEYLERKSEADFPATSEGQGRKALVVTNLSQEFKVRVSDKDSNPLLEVYPETSILFPTSDHVKVTNDNEAEVPIIIAEILYVEG